MKKNCAEDAYRRATPEQRAEVDQKMRQLIAKHREYAAAQKAAHAAYAEVTKAVYRLARPAERAAFEEDIDQAKLGKLKMPTWN